MLSENGLSTTYYDATGTTSTNINRTVSAYDLESVYDLPDETSGINIPFMLRRFNPLRLKN